MTHFDYIIAGAGCAGRSLAVRLLPYLAATGKKILLVDREAKIENDRTWCFWEQEADLFEAVVYKQWRTVSLFNPELSLKMDIAPYAYKMIKSGDFYAHTNALLTTNPQITSVFGEIENLQANKNSAQISCNGETYTAEYIFSSIPVPYQPLPEKYSYLLQHFEGWVIEAEEDIFNPEAATLMDFRTSQSEGTAFVYVLPSTSRRALVEYTLFSPALLSAEAYRKELAHYIETHLNCSNYKIVEIEKGVIPMNDHPVEAQNGRIVYLGTAGGYTKGSTGYTFKFIQKHTAAIVQQLTKSGMIEDIKLFPNRFRTYDGVLLTLLAEKKLSGASLFSTMFKRNDARLILKFLDNETSLLEEMSFFITLPVWKFGKAFLQRIVKTTT